jgi:hypothetical protein
VLPGTAGRTAQIASFTSATCPARSRNRSYSATSRLALSSSGPGLRCTVRVRPSAFRVRFHCGPCPGCSGAAHAQFGFPHLRKASFSDPRRKSPSRASSA